MDFYTFFPKILNMSLTASVAIVFVMLLRLLLKKAPKVISYALWGVVLFRLLCPVSFESGISLFGLFETPTVGATDRTSIVEYIPSNIVHTEYPEVVLPVPGIGDTITEALPKGEEQLRADPLEGPIFIATYVWWGGILVMAIYGIVTWLQLRRRLVTASPLRENIYLADDIDSPFVMGLVRPKIYLPSEMEQREQSYIILHEQYHIRRLDHIVKALAFVALCIHWFNPLVWVAFILSGKDMEMSCDEAVVLKLGTEIRADYTASLLSLASGKRIIAGMPLAFGEGNTKGRIKNLANWKKPTFWVVLISVISCVILAICLLTNPTGFKYNGSTTPIISATYFDFRAGVEGSTALNPAQISELISRLEEVKNTKKSDKFGGLTPGYQISAHLEDGSYIRISGYSLSDNEMVDIEWNDDRYVVSDTDFQDYLSRICAGDDTVQALGTFLINQPYGVVQVTYESPHYSFSMVAQENTPEYFIDENLHLYSVKEHSEYPDWTDLGVLTEISLTKDNFDELFGNNSGDGWHIRESASAIRKNTKKAWTVIYDQDKLYYILQMENGELYLAYGYYDYSEKDDPGSDDTNIRWLYLLAKQTPNKIIGYSALYSNELINTAFEVVSKEFSHQFKDFELLEIRYDEYVENRFADVLMNWDLEKSQELITVITTHKENEDLKTCVWYLTRAVDKISWDYVSYEYLPKKLTLNDIIILSQKGNELTWSDFEEFEYIEAGFGLYIRRYEINDLFHFSIGGAGPNSEPMYMYLGVNGDDPEARIDIREGGVTEFIEAHRNDTPASSAVVMIPTDTKMYGLQVGALLLPIDGNTYRYLLTDNTGEGVTADELIFEFTEPDLNRTINWEVYSLKEYPDLSVVMILSKEEGPWLCTYSPPGRCSDTALTDAINAGYVVMEDGAATHGQDVWKSFFEDTQKGMATSVIVAHYQTLDPERCDTAYFEAFNQDYPSLNLYHLYFDGTSYTLSFTDSGVEYIRNYEYLMKLEASGTPLVGNTEHKRIVHYALTHDIEHTWEELWGSLASSAFPAPIDFYTIYSENVK